MRASVREWACTPLQSPVEGPGRSVGPPDLRGRSLRVTAPAGRLESRIVCKPHLLRLSRKRVSGPVTKESARALGARGFEECRAPGIPLPSNQNAASRQRAQMAPGRSCIPNVCRARRRPRCQQVVGEPAATCARELAHIMRDVCAGAAQKVLRRLAAPRSGHSGCRPDNCRAKAAGALIHGSASP